MPIFQRSAVEDGYCRALMRRLTILRLMPSQAVACPMEASPGIDSESVFKYSQCASSNAQIQKVAFTVRCRMRSVGLRMYCLVLSQVGVSLDSASQSHKSGSVRCASLQCVCMYSTVQVGQVYKDTLPEQTRGTAVLGRVQHAHDELSYCGS